MVLPPKRVLQGGVLFSGALGGDLIKQSPHLCQLRELGVALSSWGGKKSPDITGINETVLGGFHIKLPFY